MKHKYLYESIMKLICELYRKLLQNTSVLQGKCYERPINSPYSNRTNFVKTFNDIIVKNDPVDLTTSSKEDRVFLFILFFMNIIFL